MVFITKIKRFHAEKYEQESIKHETVEEENIYELNNKTQCRHSYTLTNASEVN